MTGKIHASPDLGISFLVPHSRRATCKSAAKAYHVSGVHVCKILENGRIAHSPQSSAVDHRTYAVLNVHAGDIDPV